MRTLTAREIAAGRVYLARPSPIVLGPGVWFLGGARGVGTSTELVRQCVAFQRSADVWHVTPPASASPGAVLASITRALQTQARERKLPVPRITGAERVEDALAELAIMTGALVRSSAWIGIDLQAIPALPDLVTQIVRGLLIALPPLGAGVAAPPGTPLPILPSVRVVEPVGDDRWAWSLVERQTGKRLRLEVADLLYRAAGGIPGDLLAIADRTFGVAREQGRASTPNHRDATRAVRDVVRTVAGRITPRDRAAMSLGRGAPWGADVWPLVAKGLWVPGAGPTPLVVQALALLDRGD